LSHIVSFWKSRSDSASALVLIAAIALAGLDDGLRVLLSVLRERAFHVHFFIKLTLIIAPHVSFVFAGIYQFAFTCLAFCHTSSSKARVTLTNTLVFANDAGTRRFCAAHEIEQSRCRGFLQRSGFWRKSNLLERGENVPQARDVYRNDSCHSSSA